MTYLLSIYLVALAIFVAWYVLRQYLRGTHDLVSIRNAALLGYIVFQLTGGAFVLIYGASRTSFVVHDINTAGVIYAAMATVFLVVFLVAYERGFLVRGAAARLPVTRAVPGPILLWMLVIVFAILAVVLRLGTFPNVGGVLQLARVLGVASGVMAVAIVGWVWAPRLFNPVVIAVSLTIIVAVSLVVMTGTYGRRPLVAVAGGLFWGMYFSQLRYSEPKRVLPQLAVFSIVPLIALALFTSARGGTDRDRTGVEHVRAMHEEGTIRGGLEKLVGGQDAAGNSIWLIDQYRKGNFETRPFFTIGYLIVYPVPRDFWPGKPQPLSTELPHMATLSRVNREALTLGPGIVGHAAAEGGWFALLVYAFLGGLLIRFFDELVQIHAHNPIIVLPFGTALGNVLGMPRGETAAFTAQFLLGVIGVYIMTLILAYLLQRIYSPAAMSYVDYSEPDDEVEGLHAPDAGDYTGDIESYPEHSTYGRAGS